MPRGVVRKPPAAPMKIVRKPPHCRAKPWKMPFGDRSRTAPAIAFAGRQGPASFAVAGQIAKKFGDKDDFGSLERGISIATGSGAVVAAPCDCWVSFAGPYRTYGQLLIVNAAMDII